jgi:hypothetical protein
MSHSVSFLPLNLMTLDLNLSKGALTSSPWLRKRRKIDFNRGCLEHLLMRVFYEKKGIYHSSRKKYENIYSMWPLT